MNAVHKIGIALAASGLLLACSSTESDWQKATAVNTPASYQQFLQQHPTGPHADEAKSRMQQLGDAQAWMAAQDANSAAGYQQYLQKEPNGAHVQEAREQLAAFDRAEDWRTAKTADTAAAMQGFLQKYPQGPEADQARAELQKLSGYVADLGAFRSQKAAEAARARLEKRYSSVLHSVQVVPPSGSEKEHLVTSGPMSEADATAACTQLKKSHQHCEVVKQPAA